MKNNTIIKKLVFTDDRYQVVRDPESGKMYYLEEVTDPVTFEDTLIRYARRLLLSSFAEDKQGGLNLCSRGIDLGIVQCARMLKQWYFPKRVSEHEDFVLLPAARKAFCLLLEKGTTEEKLEACSILQEENPEQVKGILRSVYGSDSDTESRAIAGILLFNMNRNETADLGQLVKLAYAKREISLCSQFLMELFSGPEKEVVGYLDEKIADFVLRVMRLSGKQFVWLQNLSSFSDEYPWIEQYVYKVQSKEKEREIRLQENTALYEAFISNNNQKNPS